ncbi:MAG TPA: TonB-dependent receptor [Gemmatimonadales bacterium]|nr:TonB-dependent receptor [Gemmatimonadales bacterium]
MTTRLWMTAAGLLWAGPVLAQANGAIAGRVTDSAGAPITGARVVLDDGEGSATTGATGHYRLREVRSGWHRVRVSAIGYRGLIRDSVLVRSGATTVLDLSLQAMAIELEPVVVTAPVDSVLDPLATAAIQRVTAEELRRLPVSSVDEALALSAGAVGESYRGGRLGQQSFIIDGLGIKNQLDASTGGLGLRLPPDMLTEVGLITNGFSARYGQAVSGLVNVVTKDGGDRLAGRVAFETDRPLGDGWDYGLDRVVAQADGPLFGGLRFVVAADATSRLDADPVNAPAPEDPRDPRHDRPWMLPHNSGEQHDLAGKLLVPLGDRQALRLFGLRSEEQRLLYDPAFKYEPQGGPARRIRADLLSAHYQHSFERPAIGVELRVGYFNREFLRGTLIEQPDPFFGAFTGKPFHVHGEELAKARDTVAAREPIRGLLRPELSSATPWGVPAFFLGGGSRGELGWNRFRELRTQLDLTIGTGEFGEFFVGGELVRQRVETFQRAFGSLPVGDTVPPATAADFSPLAAAAYVESQFRLADLGFTAGLRYDRFDPREDLPGRGGAKQSLNPRIAISTVLRGATVVASWGSFSQAPDYQFLVDAAFDDTTRTGRFRQGNPNLGYERTWQYELSVRARPTPSTALRVNVYVRRLEGLVASVPLGVNPDSTVFGNADAGSVRGGEVIVERPLAGGFGFKLAYTLQQAEATATNAFLVRRAPRIDPVTGDTIFPAKVEFPLDFDRRHGITAIALAQVPGTAGPRLLGTSPLAGLEAAAIFRLNSGLPFSRTDPTGDTIIGLPNSSRLPTTYTVDLLLRRPVTLSGVRGSLYLDVRNLLNRRNIVAVRRDTGTPTLDQAALEALAEAAYQEHPEPIPYESPRYRAYADLDGNGYVEGREELFPLYLAAARDYAQPLFAYGPPRLIRFGMELLF